MQHDHNISWKKCLDIIQKNVNPQSFRTWFEPIKPIRLNGYIMVLQVPNKFFYEWLEENFATIMKHALTTVIGHEARLEYHILVENHKQIGSKVEVPANNEDDSNQKEYITNPFIIPGIKKTKIESNLSSKYVFDNFVEGDCNKLARAAGIEIAKKPGFTSFNPLVLFGDTGLGKTHLSQAIGNSIVANNSKKQVLYTSSDSFTNQIVYALNNNSINELMNMYHSLDVLIVDDIQFFANRPKTQEIFFNIFNQLHQAGKQIILTSDRAPKDLQDVDKRLISRFKWGLSADLNSPSFDTRMTILKAKMKTENLILDDETLEYICYHVKSNVRELEGILISLSARAALNKKTIDLTLAKEVVNQFISQEIKEISIDSIKNLVANHFKISLDKLQGTTRKREVVIARQLSMYLAKNYTGVSLKGIGSKFGGKDHSTVLYSIKAVQDLMDTDSLFKDTVDQIEKQMSMTMA
jgi:chromosomal replication initiator protein